MTAHELAQAIGLALDNARAALKSILAGDRTALHDLTTELRIAKHSASDLAVKFECGDFV